MCLTVVAASGSADRQRRSRFAYHFEGTEPPDIVNPPTREARSPGQHRNPIALAQEWQSMVGAGKCASRADLARQLGVTRARVTQVLGLLNLAPEVIEALAALGDPLPKRMVTERGLRSLLRLPAEHQRRMLRGIDSRPEAGRRNVHRGPG